MDVTFAIIEHEQHYHDFHDELLAYLQQHYPALESGVQGDAWIWIRQDGHWVSVDTFTSMQFEVKSETDNPLLRAVIKLLQARYPLQLYQPPR